MLEGAREFPFNEELPDLSTKYRTDRYLRSGRNDSCYLVRGSQGQRLVALTPISSLTADYKFPDTVRKFEKARILDE